MGSFGQGGGVYECTPKSAPDGRFRESIHMGTIESTRISTAALDRIRPDFPGDSYNVIFRNCKDFSTAFVRGMATGRNVPGYINRLARLGRSWPVRCFLPPHLKGNAASTTAPLLAAQPQQQLFQGAGQSLRGSTESSESTSGARSALKCIGSRFGKIFGQNNYTPGSDNSASNTALIQTEGDARELRAAAAARRLSGSDVEAGEGNGRNVSPMPNPWQ